MTHLIDRPHQMHRRHEQAHRQPNMARDRSAGARVLNRVDVGRPGSEKEMSMTDQLRTGVRGAALGHLRHVRELYFHENGTKLPMNADTVRLAYISQKARLNDERVTDEMTRSQLTNELMAKAVFFSPQVSDAIKNQRLQKSKEIFSEYNDILAEIIKSLPAKIEPGYKTAIVETLKLESLALNQQIGHSSEISGKDPESGIPELVSRMNGASMEIAPVNAIEADPRLRVEIPQGTELDLKGIDAIVSRPEDGKVIDIDMKGRGKYLPTVAKLQGVDWVDESMVGPYYFTGIHEVTGHPHYLLNANSFSQIPAEGFDYTPAGQEKVRRLVHQMLDE